MTENPIAVYIAENLTNDDEIFYTFIVAYDKEITGRVISLHDGLLFLDQDDKDGARDDTWIILDINNVIGILGR